MAVNAATIAAIVKIDLACCQGSWRAKQTDFHGTDFRKKITTTDSDGWQ